MLSTVRRWAPAVVIALALAAHPKSAEAVDFQGKWEVGADVLWTIYDNDSLLAQTDGYDVRGAYHYRPQHGVEFAYKIQSTTDTTRNVDRTFDINQWTLDYLYELKVKKPDSKLAPLLRMGFGTLDYQDDNQSESTTIIEGGGGVRVFFTPRLALRFDGTIFHYHGDGELIPRDGFFGFDIHVGMSFLIGSGK